MKIHTLFLVTVMLLGCMPVKDNGKQVYLNSRDSYILLLDTDTFYFGPIIYPAENIPDFSQDYFYENDECFDVGIFAIIKDYNARPSECGGFKITYHSFNGESVASVFCKDNLDRCQNPYSNDEAAILYFNNQIVEKIVLFPKSRTPATFYRFSVFNN